MSAELIERYVQEVSRRLHESQREDVSRELRSSIYDEVEHRFGPEPTDEEVVAYLRELDPPEQAAAGYRPELLYLVGPAWFPAFRTVVKIVLPIQIGLILLGFVIRIFTDAGFGDVGGEIFGFLGAVVDASVYSFGMIVLIFFGLERLEMRRPAKQRRSAKVWEPRSLPDSRPHDRVGYAIWLEGFDCLDKGVN